MTIPNLAGVATSDLVQTIGASSHSATYINWSRTMQLMRDHAPGWLPELVTDAEGRILHAAPQGAYLLVQFRHMETGVTTPAVPQAVMDNRNAAIPLDKITARDITDTHRRGACMAAALTFGLAYELWAKLPLESGYADPEPEPVDDSAAAKAGDFAAAMNDADTPEALDAVAGQLKAASLPAPLLKGLRELYATRKAALAKEAA